MFGWFFNNKIKRLEEETKKSFEAVKKDVENIGEWIKHLDSKNKQTFDMISELRRDLPTIEEEIESLKEGINFMEIGLKDKRVFKKQTPVYKQTGVYGVQTPVQTPVQTGNFYKILEGLSANERLIVFTLMNTETDMKLSYEDIARLLGKERSTVRGQINSIKQKSEDLIKEISEANGKKRVFIPEEVREKFVKYTKVRVKKAKKNGKDG